MAPGSPVPDSTLLLVARSGLPPGGVETPPQLLPAGSPGVEVDEHAVLSIDGGFAGNVAANCTANVRDAEAPAATVPSVRVQVEPAFPSGVQLHPGEEAAGRKVARAGTVSVSWTEAASRLPRLPTVRL